MKRIAGVILAGLVCYVAGGLIGFALVMSLSVNTHDRSLEAAMTGAFVAGPMAAFIGALIAFYRRWQ